MTSVSLLGLLPAPQLHHNTFQGFAVLGLNLNGLDKTQGLFR